MESPSEQNTYLFILPWSLKEIGGVNQVVINLAEEMKKSNQLQPIVLINDWGATQPITEEVFGLKTVRWRLRSYSADMGLKERLAFIFWKIRFTRRFQKFCSDHNVVAINVHFPGLQAFAIDRVVKSFVRPLPLIFSFHGSDVTTMASAPKAEVVQWGNLLSAPGNKVVVCSNDLGERLVEVTRRKLSYFVVHNGLDVAGFRSTASESSFDAERVILNVAKFDEVKGQDVLINAFSAIAAKYDDLKLVLVGGNGRALSALRALCLAKGIDSRVEFHPDIPHTDVANFYKRATLFCLPSRKEAFGIVLLEAGSFSVPVIASRVGGVPEIVSDGVNGLLVPPDNQSKLEHCIMSLLDDPVAAEEMGKNLYQFVSSDFSWSTAYKKYVDLLTE